MSRVERFSCHKEDKDHHDRVPGKYVFHKPISSGMVYRKTSTCQSIFWLQVQFDRRSIWIWLFLDMVDKVPDDKESNIDVHNKASNFFHKFLHKNVEQSKDQIVDPWFFHNNKCIF